MKSRDSSNDDRLAGLGTLVAKPRVGGSGYWPSIGSKREKPPQDKVAKQYQTNPKSLFSGHGSAFIRLDYAG